MSDATSMRSPASSPSQLLAAVVTILAIIATAIWGVSCLWRFVETCGRRGGGFAAAPPHAAQGRAAPSLPDGDPAARGARPGRDPPDRPPRRPAAGGLKEKYGDPPGFLRAVHQDELGFRGWADMPGEYEGSSASALSAFIERSA